MWDWERGWCEVYADSWTERSKQYSYRGIARWVGGRGEGKTLKKTPVVLVFLVHFFCREWLRSHHRPPLALQCGVQLPVETGNHGSKQAQLGLEAPHERTAAVARIVSDETNKLRVCFDCARDVKHRGLV